MTEELDKKIEKNLLKIAVIGMGYVGLPLALEFSKKFQVIGYDINQEKIEKYKQNQEPIRDFKEEIQKSNIYFTNDEKKLKDADIFIVTVPTPVDKDYLPDLRSLKQAMETIEENMEKRGIVIIESTVYPGTVEECCIPILEKNGLKVGRDFLIGYSPERINSGDKEHNIKNTTKIVSGWDLETTQIIEKLYQSIIDAPIYRAPDMKTAEAAKVIENIQRDINIALVNELSIIFNKMEIDTQEVLDAAATKWNFVKYQPGLVGGHCIGVDPYYLAYKAKRIGIKPNLILAGREINNHMGKYIVENIVKKLIQNNIAIKNAKVAILGITFKENCEDIRNSRVIDMIQELKEYDMNPIIYDPLADQEMVSKEYGIKLTAMKDIHEVDAIILAVPHREILEQEETWESIYKDQGQKRIMIDVKRALDKEKYVKQNYEYWGL